MDEVKRLKLLITPDDLTRFDLERIANNRNHPLRWSATVALTRCDFTHHAVNCFLRINN